LLHRGYYVTAVDDLLFGGESLLAYFSHPNFRFIKGDVCDSSVFSQIRNPQAAIRNSIAAIVHLAAIVGFPACQAVGKQVAWRYNVEAVQQAFAFAEQVGAERFVFSSTYSNYGLTKDGQPVTEESSLYPQSLYAETKIAAEQWLLAQATISRVSPLIFRFATLFGVSPRTRFDLIVNQFVLEAMTKRELIIYQRGYSRSFVHVRDVVEGICLGLTAPVDQIRGQVYNLGSETGNCTKDDIVTLVKKHVDGLKVTHKDLSFGGDMRDITVSFAKIREQLGLVPTLSVEDGVIEVRDALQMGLIKDPSDQRYRNAQFIVQ